MAQPIDEMIKLEMGNLMLQLIIKENALQVANEKLAKVQELAKAEADGRKSDSIPT